MVLDSSPMSAREKIDDHKKIRFKHNMVNALFSPKCPTAG